MQNDAVRAAAEGVPAIPAHLESQFVAASRELDILFHAWDRLAGDATKRQLTAAARLIDQATDREEKALDAFFLAFNRGVSAGDASACRAVACSLGRALYAVPPDDRQFAFERHGDAIIYMLTMMSADSPRRA